MKIYLKQASVLITFLIGFLLVPIAVSAQDTARNMEILKEKVLADRKLIVAENMQLTEAEAKDFWPLYEGYVKALEALGKNFAAIIEDYALNYQSMTDAKAKTLLDNYMAFEAERLELQHDYVPKLRKILPEKKVTRYYQIETKIRAINNYELAARIPLMK